MEQKSALDYLFQLSSALGELSGIVKVHENKLIEQDDRLDGYDGQFLSEDKIREIVRSEIKRFEPPWWKRSLETAFGTVVATLLLSFLALVSGHVHITLK